MSVQLIDFLQAIQIEETKKIDMILTEELKNKRYIEAFWRKWINSDDI